MEYDATKKWLWGLKHQLRIMQDVMAIIKDEANNDNVAGKANDLLAELISQCNAHAHDIDVSIDGLIDLGEIPF